MQCAMKISWVYPISQDCFMFPRTNWKHLKTKFREKWDCWVYSLPVPRVPSTLWKWLLLMLSGSSQLTKLGRLPTASISISHDHLKKMWFHHIYGCSIYFTWSPKNGDIYSIYQSFIMAFPPVVATFFGSIYNPPVMRRVPWVPPRSCRTRLGFPVNGLISELRPGKPTRGTAWVMFHIYVRLG